MCCLIVSDVCIVLHTDEKLPTLFILRGKLRGVIDTKEISGYPPGHFYNVEESGWMVSVGWAFLREVVAKVRGRWASAPPRRQLCQSCVRREVCVVAEEACATVVPS